MRYFTQINADLAAVLTDSHKSNHAKIHQVRVAVKRLRSIWRLVRTKVGTEVYKLENSNLRKLAKKFSKSRDRNVVFRLIRRMRKNARANKAQTELHRIEKRIKKKLHRDAKQHFRWPEALREIKRSTEHLELLDYDHKWLKIELANSEHEVQKTFAKCRAKNPRAENFHRWRRRTKNLMYQLEFLDSIGVAHPNEKLPNLKRLSEDLGAAHDYQILYDYLNSKRVSSGPLARVKVGRRSFERKSLRLNELLNSH